ncbi:MAG TPA: dihydroneopterin aldolase family protein, partial [Thermoplasmata archaeon]|nr:dihydroneopterin aldolase family protein [Thermoplasmata archaeon]
EAGSEVQPFVKEVHVKIDRTKLKAKRSEYDYVSLTGDMLDVTLVVQYKDARVTAYMKFVEEMNYPLMYIRRGGDASRQDRLPT